MLRLIFHPGFERDLDETAAFYASRVSPALAARWIREVERAIGLIRQQPGLGTPMDRGRRAAKVRDFPYLLVYRADAVTLRMLILRHERRHQRHGSKR